MEETKDKSGIDGAFERRDLMKLGVVSGVAAAITPALGLAAPQNGAIKSAAGWAE